MRRVLLLACASVALAAAVACATSEDGAPLQPPNEQAPTALPDGGTDDGSPAHDGAVPRVPSCSDAGWCMTALPGYDLTLKDIWPFDSRAFAIAESPTRGVKILEWEDAAQKWSYIDDNSQNEYGFGKYTGKIWAPNENEIYYGVAPGLIYHGRRAAPSSPWSWQRSRLDDNSRETNPAHDHGLPRYDPRQFGSLPADYPALGVWGTSAGDVYAWYANTIFHRKIEDGGEAVWVADYIAEDAENPSDTFFIFSAAGSSRDDVWFAVGRGRYDDTGVFACPMVIHRTAEGYRRIVDSTINDIDKYGHYSEACLEKPGALSFEIGFDYPEWGGFFSWAWTNGGWLTNLESAGPNAVVGILGGNSLAYVGSEDGGVARKNEVTVTVPRNSMPSLLNSVWIHGTEAWLSGWGIVLRTNNDPGKWSLGLGLTTPDENMMDGGTFSVSTTVLDGAPLDAPLYRVRGTSNTNLWAIGARYALHKTTP
jgi:hypothetical protein